MIYLKPTCDKRRKKKDGTHPILFRITLNGKSRDYSSGLSCKAKDWDYKKNSVRNKSADLDLLSKRIKDQEFMLLEKIRGFELKHTEYANVQEVKDYLCNKKEKSETVKKFWLQEVSRMKTAKNFNNAINYEFALGALEQEISMDIQFEKINYNWLIKMETILRAKGLKLNSISVYFRALRSIYNKAINFDVVEANYYPFRKYKIKSEATNPRVASNGELKKFFDYTPINKMEYDAWNYGRLIFMLRGINFTDLALLTKENIKHGRIIYSRSKTHKMYSIKMYPLVEEILGIYKNGDRETLLPILNNVELNNKAGLHARVSQQLKNCNNWLGKVGKKLEINEPLSTYVFRYSYANSCKSLGYSKDMIGEALGHNIGSKITSIYLQDYDLDVIDAMNEIVCNKVIGGE